jgi:TonB family protein
MKEIVMPPTDERRMDVARERWFWVGVGFVSALAILVIGLVVAGILTGREAPWPLVRQATVPSLSERVLPPDTKPASPPEPIKPGGVGVALSGPHASATGPLASARATVPRIPVSPVRIVERANVPQPTAPGSAAATGSRSRPVPSQSGDLGPVAARPPAEQVGGSRQEEADALSRDRVGVTSRRDRILPTIGDDGGPAASARGTTPPEVLTGQEAEYPISAMADGVTGTVELKITVDPEGFVERAVVTRSAGDRRLDAAAIRAALVWRYQPAHRGRRAVSGVDTATFEFFRKGRRERG